jgi:hypothetical protein
MTEIRFTPDDLPATAAIAARALGVRRPNPRISKAMVNAGLRVLRESGALAGELSSDHLLVRRMLEAVALVGKF